MTPSPYIQPNPPRPPRGFLVRFQYEDLVSPGDSHINVELNQNVLTMDYIQKGLAPQNIASFKLTPIRKIEADQKPQNKKPAPAKAKAKKK